MWESGAILGYLAGKTDKMIPLDPARMIETMQWVHFQASFVGPMFGQVGFFNKFAGKAYEDKRPLARYVNESKRILGVMDQRLAGRQWFMGDDYTIADISMLGWVRNLITFYEARELVAFDTFANVGGVAGARPRAARGAAGAADSEAGLDPSPRARDRSTPPAPSEGLARHPEG